MTKGMSQEEAIKILQVVERARQGRLRAKLNEESRNMNRMYKTKDPGTAAIELATVCIQKVLCYQNNPTCLFLCRCLWLVASLMLKGLNVICRCGGATYRGRGQRLLETKKWFFWEWWVKCAIHFSNCVLNVKIDPQLFTKPPVLLMNPIQSLGPYVPPLSCLR